MKVSSAVIIFIVFFAVLAGAATAYKYFFSFKIETSPIIVDQAKLMNYLGEGGLFTLPLKFKEDNGSYTYINSLSFALLKNQPSGNGNDCTAPTTHSDPMFCFTESIKNGQMIVNIYSDEGVVNKNPDRVNLLLNLNLLAVFENRLGISTAKEKAIMEQPIASYLFLWQ